MGISYERYTSNFSERLGVTNDVPKPNFTMSTCGCDTLIKFFASFTLRPLSITIVNPDMRGFKIRSGICERLKFMLLIFDFKDAILFIIKYACRFSGIFSYQDAQK